MAGRGRRAMVWALIVVSSFLAVLAILATWANRQVLDNASWKKTSAQIIQNPKVSDALSIYVVDQLYSDVDLAGQLRRELPPDLKRLAGPATAALRQPVTDGVGRVLEAPRVQSGFVDASALAHRKAVNVVENKTGFGISTGNGVVTVDVGGLVKQVGSELGLPAAALAKIPPTAGQITVMRSDQLTSAQTAARAIGFLGVWLTPLVVAMFALAIYLARGTRRQTLRSIGWAFVLVGLLVLVFRRLAGNYVVDSLVAVPNRDAMHEVWLTATGILGSIGRATVFYGLVAVLAATLAGPTGAARAVRRWMAPTLDRRPGVMWGTAGAAYLLLLLWAPTYALRQPAWILVLGAILAGGLVALQRHVRREFPDARQGALAESLRSLRRRDAVPVPPPANGSAAAEIVRLSELRGSGLITADEFDRGKTRALA
jgi:hypothetical protein